jgi:hypothetical protein
MRDGVNVRPRVAVHATLFVNDCLSDVFNLSARAAAASAAKSNMLMPHPKTSGKQLEGGSTS